MTEAGESLTSESIDVPTLFIVTEAEQVKAEVQGKIFRYMK